MNKPNTLGAELAGLLSIALPGQRLFDPLLFARFQVEGMLLQIFNDVLLLNLALKAAKRALEGFALLNDDFSQEICTSSLCRFLSQEANLDFTLSWSQKSTMNRSSVNQSSVISDRLSTISYQPSVIGHQ
jgi:hypothetical protein